MLAAAAARAEDSMVMIVELVPLKATTVQVMHEQFHKNKVKAVAMSLSGGLVTRKLPFIHGSDGLTKLIEPLAALLSASLLDSERLLSYKVIDSSLSSALLVNTQCLAVRKQYEAQV
jgi:hypothetical protein